MVGGEGWARTFTFGSLEVDGQAVPPSPWPPSYPLWLVGGSKFEPKFHFPKLGHHSLRLIGRIDVHHSDNTSNPDRGPVVHSAPVDLSAPFDVELPSPQNAVRMVKDPAMADRLRASMRPDEFQYNIWDPGSIFGMVKVEDLPTNIAFDVFCRYGGNEYPLGQIALAAGASGVWPRCDSQLGKRLPKPPPTIDIILRPSADAAHKTLDLYQIWDGELVFANVPIRDLKAGK